MQAPRRIIRKSKAVPAARTGSEAVPAASSMTMSETPLVCIDAGCENTNDNTPGQTWEAQFYGTRYRCNSCNSWRKRLNTSLQVVDELVRVSFKDDFDEAKKQEFKERHQHIQAKDLPSALNTYVEEESSEYRHKSMIKSGHFLDEIDLRKKYADKPDQLESIFKNAPTFYCKIRGCDLWGDPDFVTKDESGEGYRKTNSRKLSQEQAGFLKKQKAARSLEKERDRQKTMGGLEQQANQNTQRARAQPRARRIRSRWTSRPRRPRTPRSPRSPRKGSR